MNEEDVSLLLPRQFLIRRVDKWYCVIVSSLVAITRCSVEICLRGQYGQFLIIMTADFSGLQSGSELLSRFLSSPQAPPSIELSGAQLDVEPLTTDVLFYLSSYWHCIRHKPLPIRE